MQPRGSDASKDASQRQFSDAPGSSTLQLLTATAQGDESLVMTLNAERVASSGAKS